MVAIMSIVKSTTGIDKQKQTIQQKPKTYYYSRDKIGIDYNTAIQLQIDEIEKKIDRLLESKK
jgi:uncharacterized protein YktB (UPF0637 family)